LLFTTKIPPAPSIYNLISSCVVFHALSVDRSVSIDLVVTGIIFIRDNRLRAQLALQIVLPVQKTIILAYIDVLAPLEPHPQAPHQEVINAIPRTLVKPFRDIRHPRSEEAAPRREKLHVCFDHDVQQLLDGEGPPELVVEDLVFQGVDKLRG
jgi:hypothetical protein